MSIKIIGTGISIPEKTVTNHDLSQFLDTSDEWISSRTGISERHIVTSETATSMAEQAGIMALENAGITPSDIDLLICTTIAGDYLTPSLACCVSEKIGTTCPATDLNGACTGFIYALDMASAYIQSKKAKNVLIISSEVMSKLADWNDRSTCVLFGDGAGAVVVSHGDSLKYINIGTNGTVAPLKMPVSSGNSPYRQIDGSFLQMDGTEVFKFAVSTINKQTKLALSALNIDRDHIDFYLLHQANKRIINSARTKLGVSQEKFPVNIQKYGNISSASIPVLLHELVSENKIHAGTKLLLSAFGAGLTYGTAIIEW